VLDSDTITRVDYEETDHFQVTRRFLHDHHRAVTELLQGSGGAGD
jgi:predicted ATPase